jgi:hypothetical protein
VTPAAVARRRRRYNGAFDTGIVAMPPLMSATDIAKHGRVATAGLRVLFGGMPGPGAAATRPIGNVSVPSLFVCGTSDAAILCSRPYALKTREYCASYTYLSVDCGHDLLSCSKSAETAKVVSAIVAHIAAASMR